MTSAEALRATLEASLDAVMAEAPAAVARGRLALERALGWTARTAWPEISWKFSVLADGAPVELVWRPGRPGLFWTAEPAAPEWPRERRLERALALVRGVGSGLDWDAHTTARTAAATSDAPWPVWVAGRHDATGDAAKLYVRVGAVPPGFERAANLLHQDDRPSMIGLATGGTRELYWTRPLRTPGDRWRLRADPAIGPLASRLDPALGDWTGAGLDDPAGGRLGLSLSLGADGEPIALAAFMRVRSAGGGERVRERLLTEGGVANPALARQWAAGKFRPMLLTLAATATGVTPAIGLRVVA